MRSITLALLMTFLITGCPENTQDTHSETQTETTVETSTTADGLETLETEPKPVKEALQDKDPEVVRYSVDFVSPAEGSMVRSPVQVVMDVEGMVVKPAGEMGENTGHHHLIIDGGPVAKDQVVPADATHLHFGKGQKETEVELSPGDHTLTLQFADGAHRSYGPEMSKTIHVTVVPGKPQVGKVFFKSPQDDAQVKSPFTVELGAEGLIVLPAGEAKPNTGHHHLIIDGKPMPEGVLIPKDDTHIHFDAGSSSTQLNLEPGIHTLTAQFGDGMHLSYGLRQSKTITVTVEE